MVDPDLRIFVDSLSKMGCKVSSFFFPQDYSKEQMSDLWNKIKTDEKLIKKDGIVLRFFDDETTVLFHDPNYRVYWPSFESFIIDYPLESKKSWLVFDVPESNRNIQSCKDRKNDLFDGNLNVKPLGNGYSRFSLGNSENSLLVSDWRRYTLTMIELLNLQDIGV